MYGVASAELLKLVVRPNSALPAPLELHHACLAIPPVHPSTPPRQCFLMMMCVCVCVSQPKGQLKGGRMQALEKFLNTSGELKPSFTNRDFNIKRELIAFLHGSANGFWVCLCLLLRARSLSLSLSLSSCSATPHATSHATSCAHLFECVLQYHKSPHADARNIEEDDTQPKRINLGSKMIEYLNNVMQVLKVCCKNDGLCI